MPIRKVKDKKFKINAKVVALKDKVINLDKNLKIEKGKIYKIATCVKHVDNSYNIKLKEFLLDNSNNYFSSVEFDLCGPKDLPFKFNEEVIRLTKHRDNLVIKNQIYKVKECYFNKETENFLVKLQEVEGEFDWYNFKEVDRSSDQYFIQNIHSNKRMIDLPI